MDTQHVGSVQINKTSMGDETLPVLMAAMSSVGYLYSLLLLAFTIRFKNLRFIKMTSPRINVITLLGAILLYSFSGLPALTSRSLAVNQLKHQAQYWLLGVGFTLLMGSMLVKGWRVHQLFTYRRKKNKLIKDGNLVAGVLAMLVIDVTFMLGWQLSDPVTCDEQLNCISDHHSTWLLVLSMYKQLFIVICCFIGWSIRHVSFPAFDDGRSLLLAAGAAFLSMNGISTVMALYPHHRVMEYLCVLLCWLTTTLALSTSFLPKVKVICVTRGDEPYLTSASKYMSQPMSNNVGDELLKLLGENHYLKQRLDERDRMVSHLKKVVPSGVQTDMESSQPASDCTSSTNKSTDMGRQLLKLQLIKLFRGCCGRAADAPTHLTAHHKTDDKQPSPKTQMYTGHAQCTTLPPDSPMHTRAITAYNNDSPKSCTVDLGGVANLDLICSIADTYDLPSDSDTYSYISNCLMQRSFESTADSRGRKLRRSQGSLCDNKVSTSEAGFGGRRHHKQKYRSRSQSATRKARVKYNSGVSTNIMTDSNCSTVIV